MTIDYISLGFALTTPDVAQILGRTEAEVHDLARAGLLPFLASGDGTSGPLRMWFHPDEVTRLEVSLRKSVQSGGGLAVDHRNRIRVQSVLRDYLAETPPVRSYDLAMLHNAPLVSKTRQRAEVVHVRPEAVAAFGSRRETAPVTISMVTAALEYFGALRVRGITAVDEPGKQRWGVWFRLPPGFAAGDDDEPEVIEGIAVGAYEPGDRIARRGMGPAVAAGTLRGLDDDAID